MITPFNERGTRVDSPSSESPSQDPASTPEQFGALPIEIQELALSLAMLMSRMSRESRYHLGVALQAHAAGIKGDLLLKIPSRVTGHIIVKWVGGGIDSI